MEKLCSKKLEEGTGIFEVDYYYKDFEGYEDPLKALETKFWEDLENCLHRYGWEIYDVGDVESQFSDLDFTCGSSFQEIVVIDQHGRQHILERRTSFDKIGTSEVIKYVGPKEEVYPDVE